MAVTQLKDGRWICYYRVRDEQGNRSGGLRPGAVELLSLTWRQVNLEKNTILLLSAHKGGPEKRLVPIHEALLPLLAKWHEEDKETGHIIHYHGKPVKNIAAAWHGALKRAGILRRKTIAKIPSLDLEED